MAQRLTRIESRQRTRADLLAAARRVFLDSGFHAASLDEIAARAGYSKGAVYSNFAGKDELFLAVLADYYDGQARRYSDVVVRGASPEDVYRGVARFFLETVFEREPQWMPLVAEFMTRVSRRPALRRAFAEVRARFLDGIAELIEDLARRHRIRYRLPAGEVALGSSALLRGLALERMARPESLPIELAEEIHTAYMRGLTLAAGDEGVNR